ncbi:MAG: PQQ-binding-like beta-propeller repeat protein [Candidatus Eremiobacteraeota bacterium]|nr:PQQ-binding-like beta-propeller repeat protein [Candidatus Eremiobacteraeota bacterium]
MRHTAPIVTLCLAGTIGSASAMPTVNLSPHGVLARPLARTSSKTSWVRYGYDVERTNSNPSETTLNPSNVGNLKLKWSKKLNGATMTQPILVTNVLVSGKSIDVVYEGDEAGTLWALNAADGATVWTASLGMQHNGCGQAPNGDFGVTSTPVVDVAAGRIYAAGGNGLLQAFNLATGATINSGFPVQITNIPKSEYVWSALNLNESLHTLYATTASFCDISPYHGRVVAVDTQTGTIVARFYVTGKKGPDGGGIWGWGGASLEPSSGQVFVGTGNALTSPENYRYSDQVVKLSSALHILQHNYPHVSGGDVDIGSTPALYQASGCPAQLAVESKSGALLVYDQATIRAGAFQRLQVADMGGDFIGETAYAAALRMLFVSDPSDSPSGPYKHGMLGFAIGSDCKLSLNWQKTLGPSGDVPSPPVFANGVVYYGDASGSQEIAFNATTGAELWNSGSTIGGSVYAAPSVVNGRLYVSSWDGHLYVFGL